ncbi:MAG: inositol monophosphatase family protein [Hyphomonadaceae bacterium]
MSELKDLLAIAERIAAEAGRGAQGGRRDEWNVIAAEEGREVKIDADTRAEALILAALEQAAPYPVISEEAGWVRDAGREGYVWAVDPLDGSVNYLRGYPHCAVSIALLNGQ